MSITVSSHIRSNVVGYLALFLALSGTAYATHPGGANTISSGDIINGEVKSLDLGDGEVKNDDLGVNAVGSAKINDRSVKNADLSIGASSSNTIADGGVQGVDVKNNTLTGTQIDESTLFNDNSLTGTDIDESTLSGVSSEPSGPAGGDLSDSYPNPTIADGAIGGGRGGKISDNTITDDDLAPETQFNGAAASGALAGSYPNPRIADDAVDGSKVADDSLTGDDVDESTLSGVPSTPAGPAGGDLAGTYPNPTIADGAVTIPKLDFDPATQTELDGHAASGDHDGRYLTEAELSTSDGDAPNAGSNFVHWDVLAGVPGGFADGADDDSGGTVTEVNTGTGLTGGPLTTTGTIDILSSYRLPQSCANGQVAKSNGSGSWSCAADEDTQGGLPLGCASGQVAKSNGADSWSCAEDTQGADWRLAGNSGTTSSDFLGTTDNNPLNLRVNDARALRLEPASDTFGNQSPNVIGGTADNSVTAGVHSATVSGGGRRFAAAATANRVTDNQGTVGGGADNQAGDADADPTDATRATVGGGASNTATNLQATVGGGGSNTASGEGATVGGGAQNNASGGHATLGGGSSNTAGATGATVGGGGSNTASGSQATVGGGGSNTASGSGATVSGGSSNTASAQGATVAGGFLNTAAGINSFAAGTQAKANHDGALVWADRQFSDMASTAPDQFIARAQGEFFLQSDSTLDDQGGFLNTSTGGFLSTGGAWTNASDESLKSGFEPVGPRGVLERVAALPVRSWEYDAEPGVRHLGPTAQDFHHAFGLGNDDRHIASVDADGVALAAIKGLSKEVDRLRRKLASLKQREESR